MSLGWTEAALALTGLACGGATLRERVLVPRQVVVLALGLFGLMALQLIPLSAELREQLVPGVVAAESGLGWVPDAEVVTERLVRHDLEATLGVADQTVVIAPEAMGPMMMGPVMMGPVMGSVMGSVGGPMALDPPAQQARVVVWVMALGLGWLAWMGSGPGLARGLLLLGVVQAVVGLAFVDGPTRLVGPKEHYLGFATGTLVNKNHFGALMVGCLLPGVVLARQHRWVWFGVFMMGAALLASGSRGAWIAGLVGLVALRHKHGLGAGVVLGLGALATGRLSGWGDDPSTLARLEYWQTALDLWQTSPWFGVGAGGFALLEAGHLPGPWLSRAIHVHSDPLQVLLEHGVVASVLLQAAVVAMLWFGRHKPMFWAGVLSMVVVGFFDFFWMTPLGIALVAVLGGACLPRPSSQPTRSWWPAMGVLLVVSLRAMPTSEAARDHQRVRQALASAVDGQQRLEAEGAIRDLVRLQPRNPLMYLDVAQALSRFTDYPDGTRHRIGQALEQAVGLDPWLAPEAVALAGEHGVLGALQGSADPGIQVEVGKGWIALGELDKAEAALVGAGQRCDALYHRGTLGNRLQLFEAALGANGCTPAMRGWAMLRLGRLNEAEHLLKDQPSVWARLGLARIRLKQNRTEEAEQLWQKLQLEAPNDPGVVRLGQLLDGTGRP